MREILFRGKRVDNGKWAEGDLIQFQSEIIIYAYESECRVAQVVMPATIGQFTGLTDKNGKEIFEGDILDCGDRITCVKWHQPCGQWDSQFIRYVRELSSNGITAVEWKFRASVIGNIHDNPELIGGRND